MDLGSHFIDRSLYVSIVYHLVESPGRLRSGGGPGHYSYILDLSFTHEKYSLVWRSPDNGLRSITDQWQDEETDDLITVNFIYVHRLTKLYLLLIPFVKSKNQDETFIIIRNKKKRVFLVH